MSKFCIGTLTHDSPNRDVFLRWTIDSFMLNTNVIKGTKWYVYHNGPSGGVNDIAFNEMKEKWGHIVDFELHHTGQNMGVGYGINALNQHLKSYEYSLFLEGDWITLPEVISGFNKDWLNDCISLLDKDIEVDQIQLRRYLNDIDDRQYGFGYWIRRANIKKETDKFIYLHQREYGNNPTVRRNQKHYDVGIFPLKEFINENNEPQELKGNPFWGQAEIVASGLGYKLGSVTLKFGNFVHCDHWQEHGIDFESAINRIKGCGYKTASQTINCKYGFTFPREQFCLACRKSQDFTDLEEHNKFFEEQVHRAFWEKQPKEKIKEIILSNIELPPDTIDIDEYIDNTIKNFR